MSPTRTIRTFEDKDEEKVIHLWTVCGLVSPLNDPALDIERKKLVRQGRTGPQGLSHIFLTGPLFAGHPLPAWVGELGIRDWAQYFLNFIFGDERVQFAMPATSGPAYLQDFLSGGHGPLPSAAQHQKVRQYFQGLARTPHL